MNDTPLTGGGSGLERRVSLLVRHLDVLKTAWTLRPITEREVRTLWFSLFQLGGVGAAMGHPDLIHAARHLLAWVEITVRQGTMVGTIFEQRLDNLLKDTRLQELSPRPIVESLDGVPGWGDQVLVVDNTPDRGVETTLRQQAISVYTMDFTPTQILRTARVMRPHLMLINSAAVPSRDLASLCAVLRDDKRLEGMALYLYTLPSEDLSGSLMAHVDGIIRQPLNTKFAVTQIFGILARVNQRRDSAIWEPYTDLYSLQYLRERLAEEIIRQQRTARPLGIIAVTWDPQEMGNNDPKEEEVYATVRRLAHYLQARIRLSDVVSYDGLGRFYLVLLDATRRVISDRMKMIEQQIHADAPLGPRSLMTGLALAPDHGHVPEDLFAHADDALWDALDQRWSSTQMEV